MRAKLFGAACLCLATTGQAGAEQSLGACELTGLVHLMAGTRIEWDFDPTRGINNASLFRSGKSFPGAVINFRSHDDGTSHGRKINVAFWEAGALEHIEIVVMRRATGSSVGAVIYRVINDEVFADVMIPFTDATCVYR